MLRAGRTKWKIVALEVALILVAAIGMFVMALFAFLTLVCWRKPDPA
jgi:hypothetical protein